MALSAMESNKTPDQIAALLGGVLVGTDDQRWWQITLSDIRTTVTIGAADRDKGIREIEMTMESATGLRLRDLRDVIGDYKVVFESKTSSVRFLSPPATGIVAYADLLSSKVLPDATVVAVILRRS